MIYLTHSRLMTESEQSVHEHARAGDGIDHSVCSQVVASRPRYSLWISRHDRRMLSVAVLKWRDRQITTLRSVAVEQVHRTALVRYFRDYGIKGADREQTLRELYGARDVAGATLAEHRSFLVAATSEICVLDLLELAGDRAGLDMLRRYEATYGHYFSMHWDDVRARQSSRPYLLGSLVPELKANAAALRRRIVSGARLPARSRPPSFGGSVHFRA